MGAFDCYYYLGFATPVSQAQPAVTTPPPAIATRPPPVAPVVVKPWTNSLGMKFVPAGTANVLFCTMDVRVRDFQAYVDDNHPQQLEGIFVTKGVTDENGHHALSWELEPDASWENPGFDSDQIDIDPVVGVNWNDAKAFCQWLTKKEHAAGKLPANKFYRLPTDAEWSVAVGTGKYPWGDSWPPPKDAGNYADQAFASSLPGTGWSSIMLPENDGQAQTSPGGTFRANAYGLYDMGGNVWQWCEDWYQASMNSDEVRKKFPILAKDGGGKAYKVLRGASWDDNDPEYILSSCRSYDFPTIRYADRGFRVVVAPLP